MKITRHTVGMFQVNTWLAEDPGSGACAIIDTGEGEALPAIYAAMNPRPDVQAILLTHAHFDHAGALVELQQLFPDALTCLPRLERPMFDILPRQGELFGMPQLNRPCGRIDRDLDDGDQIQVGEQRFRFVSTPGHTPGQGCYYTDEDIFVGDTLFQGSIGRVDFPMSDAQLAHQSLRKLLALPGHLIVHPGHGPDTKLAEELRSNPYLAYLRAERGMPEGYAVPW